jgi:sugar phosphate isomerase/epimerase
MKVNSSYSKVSDYRPSKLNKLQRYPLKNLIRIISALFIACPITGFSGIGNCETPSSMRESEWPFFAFDNGVGRDQGWQPTRQAELLSRLGYDGIGYSGLRNVEARISAFNKHDQKVFSFYERCSLDESETLDPDTVENLPHLEGTDAILWLLVTGKSTEEEAVARFRNVADVANKYSIKVALYPHDNTFVETGDHALKLAKLVNRENFGISINVCHELKAGKGENLVQLVKDSIDHLYLVSINGADRVEDPNREKNWSRLIQPLDQGDFDIVPLLEQLRESGYEGPIGLQCYQISGEIEAILQNSISAWNELLSKSASD